jgi:hypothetical protein
MSYAAFIKTDGDRDWVGNGLRFATEKEALDYVDDLACRWTAVRHSSVEKSKDRVTHEWKDGQIFYIGEL